MYWDHYHGRESQHPTKYLSPNGVLIFLVVSEGLVLNDGIQQYCLFKDFLISLQSTRIDFNSEILRRNQITLTIVMHGVR
jgi:hypothetical protein